MNTKDAVTIRMPVSSILAVSSADRYTSYAQKDAFPTSPFKFRIQSKQNFVNGFFDRIALTELTFPWNFPTLSSRNNKINIVVGGVTTTLTLTEGYYTPTTLGAELQAKVIAAGLGLTNFLIFVEANSGTFHAEVANGSTLYRFTRYVDPLRPTANTLYDMINWNFKSIPVRFQDSGIPTMLFTPFVDIVSSQLTTNQDIRDTNTSGTARDIIARIYLTADGLTADPELIGSQPFTVYRQFATPKQIKWSKNQPIAGNLEFELFDSTGNSLAYPQAEATSNFPESNDSDWFMTLLVSES